MLICTPFACHAISLASACICDCPAKHDLAWIWACLLPGGDSNDDRAAFTKPSSCSHIYLSSYQHWDSPSSLVICCLHWQQVEPTAVIHLGQDFAVNCDSTAKHILWQQTAVLPGCAQTQLVIWQVDCDFTWYLSPEHGSGIFTPSVAGFSLGIAWVKRAAAGQQQHVIDARKWVMDDGVIFCLCQYVSREESIGIK